MTRSDAAMIDTWLRAACVWPDDVEVRQGVDMTAEAITHRIRELAEMSSLCLALGELGERHRDAAGAPADEVSSRRPR